MGWNWTGALGGLAAGGPVGAVVGGLAGDKIANTIGGLADESESAKRQREMFEAQGGKASEFADQAQGGYGGLGVEAQAQRDYLRRLAAGQEPSLAREQFRQGMQQNVAAQRSMAAGAAPQNAAMAARTAAIQAGRVGSGMAGQAALAGMQERQQAQQALAQLIMQQRQQELQAALGGRQTAISGYGGATPDKSWLDKWGGAIVGGASLAAKSDERAKTDIRDGDKAANRAIDGLKAFTYRYKDERDGKGKQLGPMAQDLERAGLKHTVMNTPDGKMVHGAKLSLTNTALISALANRVKKLEGGAK